MRYVVSYSLPYLHRVMVGIEASSEEAALTKAQAFFEEGSLWDDTWYLPLLYDDYEEDGDAGKGLQFSIKQTLAQDEAYPPPDASVLVKRRRNAAQKAAELLVAAYRRGEATGSVAW